MFFDRKPVPAAIPDLANLKVSDARVGDVLSVSGAASDFSDVDFTVDRRDQLEAGSQRWIELSGMWRDRRVYLQVQNNESVQVAGNFDGRKLTLDEIGLSEQDLADLDSRQNSSDFFDFEGQFWLYRFSRETGVFSNASATGTGFYTWQFEEQGGKRSLSIRKYQREPFSAVIWVRTEPADITVYRGA